jgi:hypothetical protein
MIAPSPPASWRCNETAHELAFAHAHCRVVRVLLRRASHDAREDVACPHVACGAHDCPRAVHLENATAWDAGEIWTFTSFEVREAWKGAPPETITVRLLGGTFGDLESSVSGVPRFQPGEDVVLFLERTSRSDFSVVSWEQGTFRIRRDARTGEQIATQDTASFATFDTRTRRFQADGIRNVPLDLLRAQVQAALAQRMETHQ